MATELQDLKSKLKCSKIFEAAASKGGNKMEKNQKNNESNKGGYGEKGGKSKRNKKETKDVKRQKEEEAFKKLAPRYGEPTT